MTKTKTVAELRDEKRAAATLEDKARIAKEIEAAQIIETDAAERELHLECTVLECDMREAHGLDHTTCLGISSLAALKKSGCGILIVRNFDEYAPEQRQAAVKTLARMGQDPKTGDLRFERLQTDEASVVSGLLKACLYPDPKTQEGQQLIQRLVHEQLSFTVQAYRMACDMTIAVGQTTGGK